jgi:ribosome-associated protein
MTGVPRLVKLRTALDAALAKGAEEPLALDVRDVVSFADSFLIVTARSDRQVRAVADAVAEALVGVGEKPLGIEGLEEGRWALLDFGDLIVHVFLHDARETYALDRLWSDASVIGLPEESAQPPRGAAGARERARPPHGKLAP